MAKGFTEGYETYDTSEGLGSAKEWRQTFRERMTSEEAEQVLQSQEETPHQILGISTNATQRDIKAAFRQLISQWHPDKNQGNLEEAEAMSKRIIAAYTKLKD